MRGIDITVAITLASLGAACSSDDETCTVKGERIVCSDGTSIDFSEVEGVDASGTDGTPGSDGQDGTPGTDGQDGTSCTVTDTAEGALITCTDGTEALVADGAPGTDGQDGVDATASELPFQNGSRLTASRYAGADGSSYPVFTFYDSQLDVNCNVARHADGSLRCLPSGPGVSASYFADSSCSVRVAVEAENSYVDPPSYLVETEIVQNVGSRNDPYSTVRYRIFNVGAVHNGLVYYAPASGCIEYPAALPYDVYLVGSEVPASTFVEFTVE